MAKHLLVLQHGIAGCTDDLRNLADALGAAYPERFHVVLSDVNTGSTDDGVVAGGRRLADLIKREAACLSGCGGSISFVTHSLGGIYARSALRQLEEETWFESNAVASDHFVTLATPHLGIGEVGSFWRWGIWLFGGAIGDTVVDLTLGSGIMEELTDELALRTLRRFRRRIIYGNIDDDMWVRICSSLILPAPPATIGFPPGEPSRLEEDELSSGSDEELAGGGLDTFPEEQRELVSIMISRLYSMPWERYVVHFPYDWWTGAAHVKICHHGTQDLDHHGLKVQAHVCDAFLIDFSEER